MTPALGVRDRRALIIGGAALLIMLGYSQLLRPAMATMQSDREAAREQRELLSRERALVAAAPMLPRRHAEARQALQTASGRLFSGDSVAATAALTSYLADIATATGVRLTSVDGRPPATSRGLTRLVAELRGEASWRQTLAFVRTLESTGRLVDVTDLRIERGPRGGPLGGDLVTISATVSGYAMAQALAVR